MFRRRDTLARRRFRPRRSPSPGPDTPLILLVRVLCMLAAAYLVIACLFVWARALSSMLGEPEGLGWGVLAWIGYTTFMLVTIIAGITLPFVATVYNRVLLWRSPVLWLVWTLLSLAVLTYLQVRAAAEGFQWFLGGLFVTGVLNGATWAIFELVALRIGRDPSGESPDGAEAA